MKYNYNLINLNNIIEQESCDIKEYFYFNGIRKFDDCDIESLLAFANKITNKEGFNVSYTIERLDKEFDLIKYGDNILVNIELKLSSKDKSQCEKNYELLKTYYSKETIYIFCYEKNKDAIFKYNYELKKFEESSFEELDNILNEIKNEKIVNINFNVSSVYINPEFYLKGEYSLSKSQEKLKKEIIDSSEKVILVQGRAGTGKSLLALDMYKYYKEKDKGLIYLCPFKVYNIMSSELLNKMNIKTVRSYLDFINKEKNDIVIVDEAQRLNIEKIDKLKLKTIEKLILFGDINQSVDCEDGFKKIYEEKSEIIFNIKQVIRTDDTFDYFAKKILGKPLSNLKNKQLNLTKVKIYMKDDANIPNLSEYTFLEPGKSFQRKSCYSSCNNKICDDISQMCNSAKTIYDVISLEYKKVAMCFCHGYYINSDRCLTSKESLQYGNIADQLYSLITRTIEELVIVVDDIKLYNFLNKVKENQNQNR